MAVALLVTSGRRIVVEDDLWRDMCATLGIDVEAHDINASFVVERLTRTGLVTRDIHPDLDLVLTEALRVESVITVVHLPA